MNLDDQLIAAHARGDRTALVTLYQEAASKAPTPDARAFFLTQAYIFALETGDAQAQTLRSTLSALGSELPDPPKPTA